MKKDLVGLAALFAFMVGSASLSSAFDVTIKNGTPYRIRVFVYVTKDYRNDESGYGDLGPGVSYTFKTGGWCPSGMEGFVRYDVGETREIASTSILGHETGRSWFSPGCWNSSWTVCRKRGTEGTPVQDRDYGFCR